MSTGPALAIADLACGRGSHPLLRAVTLTLEAGQALHLTGPNGLGKTTLLRALLGLSRIHKGQIGWGAPPQEITPRDLTRLSVFLPATVPIKPGLSVAKQVRHLASLHGLAPSDAALAATLSAVGLQGLGDVGSHRLSSGQSRRTLLALLHLLTKATAAESPSPPRPLWLLDEPTLALDTTGKALLGHLVDQHRQNHGMVLVVSHEPPPFAVTQALDVSAWAAHPADQKGLA